MAKPPVKRTDRPLRQRASRDRQFASALLCVFLLLGIEVLARWWRARLPIAACGPRRRVHMGLAPIAIATHESSDRDRGQQSGAFCVSRRPKVVRLRDLTLKRCRSANLTRLCFDQLTRCLERRIGVDGFVLSFPSSAFKLG